MALRYLDPAAGALHLDFQDDADHMLSPRTVFVQTTGTEPKFVHSSTLYDPEARTIAEFTNVLVKLVGDSSIRIEWDNGVPRCESPNVDIITRYQTNWGQQDYTDFPDAIVHECASHPRLISLVIRNSTHDGVDVETVLNIRYEAMCVYNSDRGGDPDDWDEKVTDQRSAYKGRAYRTRKGSIWRAQYSVVVATSNASLLEVFKNYAAKHMANGGLEKGKSEARFSILTSTNGQFTYKATQISAIDTDISVHYNDDFVPINDKIVDALNNTSQGIVLLHGPPGTGKTCYLRHLIRVVNKKFVLITSDIIDQLSSPGLITFMMNNPDVVFVVEEAENILQKREVGYNMSAIANLLNLGDGLLNDALRAQVICTFNASIDVIDPAIMRNGRLIANYEFGQLTAERASELFERLTGARGQFEQPTTVADVYAKAGDHEAVKPADKPKRTFGFM